MRWLIAIAALLVAVPAMAQAIPATAPPIPVSAAEASARESIRVAMLDSAEGWNRGDVDRFLAIYSVDPATSFTGRDLARGRAQIRARYLANYPGQFGAAVPETRLSFTFEDLRMLGDQHALLIARWRLVKRGDEAHAQTGMTSLIFRSEPGGWKIIADHSS